MLAAVAPTTSGQSFGLDILAGTTSGDYGLKVRNAANTKLLAFFAGDDSGSVGPGLAWGTGGNYVISATSSVTAVTVNGAASANALNVNGGTSGNMGVFNGVAGGSSLAWQRSGVTIGDIGSGDSLFSGGSSTDFGLEARSGIGVAIGANATKMLGISAAGNFTFAAPSSGVNLATFASTTGDIITARDSGNSFQLALGSTASFAYLDASNASSGLALTTQGSANVHLSISNAGNVAINAPSSGVTIAAALAAPSVANDRGVTFANAGVGDARVAITTASAGNAQLNLDTFGVQNWVLGNVRSDGSFRVSSSQTLGTSDRLQISVAGGVQIGSPTGGDKGAGTLNMLGCFVNGVACLSGAAAAGTLTGTTLNSTVVNSSLTSVGAVTSGSFPAANLSGGTLAGGIVNSSLTSVGAITSGSFPAANLSGSTLPSSVVHSSLTDVGVLTNLSVSGAITAGASVASALVNATSLLQASQPVYAGIPQNSQSGTYTLVASDANKHVYKPSGSATITIPANSSISFPIGTAITIINDGNAACSIAITTDTMVFSPSGSVGTRTLAVFGEATLLKVGNTRWYINGTGITKLIQPTRRFFDAANDDRFTSMAA